MNAPPMRTSPRTPSWPPKAFKDVPLSCDSYVKVMPPSAVQRSNDCLKYVNQGRCVRSLPVLVTLKQTVEVGNKVARTLTGD